VTAGFGAVLALPALRVTGPYLAMVTLAFGTIIQILINEMSFLTEGAARHQARQAVALRPPLDEREFYWVVLVLMVLALVVVHRTLRSHLGRAFEALRGSPVAVGLHGRLGVPLQGLRVRHQRRLRRPGGNLYAYPEQYISPKLVQLRAHGAVPARHHHGRAQEPDRRAARCDHHRAAAKLLDDIEIVPLRLGGAGRARSGRRGRRVRAAR
jgi:hypothetical protein